jgi:hypothetical protein
MLTTLFQLLLRKAMPATAAPVQVVIQRDARNWTATAADRNWRCE